MGFLLDDNAVKGFLFEVQLAIQFFHQGHDVKFMDLEDKANYDLLVSNGSEEIEVECKRKSADAGRKIHRADFYLLADILFARLHQINKRFVVLIESEGPMGGNTSLFYEIANAIEKCIATSKSEDQIKHIQFKIEMLPSNLRIRSNLEAAEVLTPYYSRSSHYAIFSNQDTTLLVKAESTVRDKVLRAIYDELKAGSTQLSGTRPGLLACFLEDIDDAAWDQLKENSGLQAMTARLMANESRRHVNLAVYSSDRSPPTRQGNVLSFPAMHVRYWNPKARFGLSNSFLGFS